MSEHSAFSPEPAPDLPLPQLHIGPETQEHYDIRPDEIARTMQIVGVSDEFIPKTTIVFDDRTEFRFRGAMYPRWFAQKLVNMNRFPDLGELPGPLMHVPLRYWGKEQSAERLNKVLAHEFAHVAQMERKDPWLIISKVATLALRIGGAVAANQLTKGRGPLRALATIVGHDVGHFVGYQLVSPIERQARRVAKTITTTAVRPRHDNDEIR